MSNMYFLVYTCILYTKMRETKNKQTKTLRSVDVRTKFNEQILYGICAIKSFRRLLRNDLMDCFVMISKKMANSTLSCAILILF